MLKYPRPEPSFDNLESPFLDQEVVLRGHGAISPDGDLIRFEKKGSQWARVKRGETGGILLDVARSLDRVLKGEDILVRTWEPRRDPTNDSHIIHRNATILASQAMHLGDWFFRARPSARRPADRPVATRRSRKQSHDRERLRLEDGMSSSFEELESPYLEGESDFVAAAHELSTNLVLAISESPFAGFRSLPAAERDLPWQKVIQQVGLEHDLKASAVPPCPRYEPGEQSASKKEPGILSAPVVEVNRDVLLVADFGVDWRHVKPATKRDSVLIRWLSLAKSDPSATFEVIGYSDCIAPPAHNDFLRSGRARQVAALVGPRAVSIKKAPRGVYLTSNLTRVGRAMNRGATIRVIHAVPKWRPPAFVRPESVVEMQEILDDAENMLVDPFQVSLTARRRLYGPGPIPMDWKPDVPGALRRIDAALDFVKPLIEPTNIKSHGRDDVKAAWLGLFHTAKWLENAATSYAEVRRLRDQVSPDMRGSVLDLAVKGKSLLAFRASEALKVLADEGLSFELELGSSPKPAPSYRSAMRAQLPRGAALNKRELRVLAWLRDNKDALLEAERAFRVDRRAIAAVIAWEAMHNIMRGGLRGVGPGKMHTYDSKWAGVIPFLPKGDAVPQQVEDRGLVPKPKDDEERRIRMTTPTGAMTYIAAAMRAAIDIAAAEGFEISTNLAALTSFYQGHDLPSWERHIKGKKARSQTTFVAADPIAVWATSHVDYLESAFRQPAP